jgi:hypothetical protein
MLQIYDTCKQFLRTIPELCMDEDNPEDIDDQSEDHPYDSATLLFLHRPTEEIAKSMAGVVNRSRRKAA